MGDRDYNPLFPWGFGLKYGHNGELAALPEARATVAAADPSVLFAAGRPGATHKLLLGSPGALPINPGPELIDARPADHRVQEDSVRLHWTGAGAAMAAIAREAPVNLTRESNSGLAIEMEFRVDAPWPTRARRTTAMVASRR